MWNSNPVSAKGGSDQGQNMRDDGPSLFRSGRRYTNFSGQVDGLYSSNNSSFFMGMSQCSDLLPSTPIVFGPIRSNSLQNLNKNHRKNDDKTGNFDNFDPKNDENLNKINNIPNKFNKNQPFSGNKERFNVGFLTVALGKYYEFLLELIESSRLYLLRDHNVHWFVFTDNLEPSLLQSTSKASNVTLIPMKQMGWPFDSLCRNSYFKNFPDITSGMDFLYALDCDLLFVNPVGEEILSDRVATFNAWFFGANRSEIPYEDRLDDSTGGPISSAFFNSNEGGCYFGGGLFGGSYTHFYDILDEFSRLLNSDLSHPPHTVAVWHDESYLNRVFFDKPPTLILGPNYLYPEPPADLWLYQSHFIENRRAPFGTSDDKFFTPRLLNLGVRKVLKNQEMEVRSASIHNTCPVLEPKNRVFLAWTAGVWGWRSRHQACIESLFFHHPEANVQVFSNSLPESFFSKLSDIGYRIRVVRFNPLEMGKDLPGFDWLQELGKWRTGKWYTRHLVDFLRFLVLYKYGGIFADFDTLWVKEISSVGNSIGMDVVTETDRKCGWCLHFGDSIPLEITSSYLAPKIQFLDVGSPILERCLSSFLSDYDPTCADCSGSRLLTESWRLSRNVSLLPKSVFYPLGPLNVVSAFTQFDQTLSSHIDHHSLAVHLMGGLSDHIKITPNSLVLDIIQKKSLLNGDTLCTSCHYSEAISSPFLHCSLKMCVPEFPPFSVRNPLSFNCIGVITSKSTPFGTPLSLTVSAKYGAFSTLNSSLQKAITFHSSSPFWLEPLEELKYHHGLFYDDDQVDITVSSPWGGLSSVVDLKVSPRMGDLVTLGVKTMGRFNLVRQLIASVRKYYPSMLVIIVDDSGEYQEDSPFFDEEHVQFFALQNDSGLSFGRNFILEKAPTDVVLLLDDDFLLTDGSSLHYMYSALIDGNFDIVGGTSPVDENRFGGAYQGLINKTDEEMVLSHGHLGLWKDCLVLEITPNLLLLKRDKVLAVGWDPILKLGEHEDFFYRAKLAGLRVALCPSVSFHHNFQEAGPHYSAMRSRVWDFFEVMLKKHNVKRLVSFGWTTFDIERPRRHVIPSHGDSSSSSPIQLLLFLAVFFLIF